MCLDDPADFVVFIVYFNLAIEYLAPKILTEGDSSSNGRVSMEVKIVAVTSCNVELENVLDILDVHCRLHCFCTFSDKIVTVRKLSTCFISNCAKDLLVNDTDEDSNCVFLKDLRIRSTILIQSCSYFTSDIQICTKDG